MGQMDWLALEDPLYLRCLGGAHAVHLSQQLFTGDSQSAACGLVHRITDETAEIVTWLLSPSGLYGSIIQRATLPLDIGFRYRGSL